MLGCPFPTPLTGYTSTFVILHTSGLLESVDDNTYDELLVVLIYLSLASTIYPMMGTLSSVYGGVHVNSTLDPLIKEALRLPTLASRP